MTIAPPFPDQGLPIAPPSIIPLLVELADCICGALANEGAGPTCWCGLYPGAEVAWDYCGECSGGTCGMGWVQLSTIFPYTTFPLATVDFRCASPLAWGIRVGSLRCLPTRADGEPLSAEQMTDAAIAQYLDGRAIWSALKCCDASKHMALETYFPVGPLGGCVGGYWTAFIEDLALMASDVQVDIPDVLIISALNTPGGAVFEWRDEAARRVIEQATATAPIGDIDNQRHRTPTVGEFKRSFGFDRVGSNGHRVQATIYNGSEHAIYAEEGRSPSGGYERFTWSQATPPGSYVTLDNGTRGWTGFHTLRNACNAVGAQSGDWSPLA